MPRAEPGVVTGYSGLPCAAVGYQDILHCEA